MGRRTTVLIVAVLLAAIGAGLVFVYANNANNRALADQKPVQVLVAKTEIPAGTAASVAEAAGDFQAKDIASASVTPGAISDVAPLAGEVAIAPIFPGEQIIAAQFGQSGAITELPIPAGDVAISVQLGDPNRVAGFVQPGSHVAIFVTMSQAAGNSGGASTTFTQLLLPNVEVLAAGPTTFTSTTTTTASGQTNTEQIPRAILTLALNQAEAQKTIYASQNGTLYFGLLTSKSIVSRGAPVNASNLFS